MAARSQAGGGPEAVARVRHELGLDVPFHEQYVPLRGARAHRRPRPLLLHESPGPHVGASRCCRTPCGSPLAAMGITVVAGVGLGLLAAVYHDTWVDRLAMLLSLGGLSIPIFWSGLLLILLFAVTLRWLPITGGTEWQRLDPAGGGARLRRGRVRGAPDAIEHARGPAPGLHHDRPRQGASRGGRHPPARVPERHAARAHAGRPPVRPPPRRRRGRGGGVRAPGGRAARDRRHPVQGLPPGPGRGAVRGADLRRHQPGWSTSSTSGSTRGSDTRDGRSSGDARHRPRAGRRGHAPVPAHAVGRARALGAGRCWRRRRSPPPS